MRLGWLITSALLSVAAPGHATGWFINAGPGNSGDILDDASIVDEGINFKVKILRMEPQPVRKGTPAYAIIEVKLSCQSNTAALFSVLAYNERHRLLKDENFWSYEMRPIQEGSAFAEMKRIVCDRDTRGIPSDPEFSLDAVAAK